uniref:Uncharacterized protein n=1 Tax=Arundo donax TaxID=35708 RepID=A0A0A9E727_ARUDO
MIMKFKRNTVLNCLFMMKQKLNKLNQEYPQKEGTTYQQCMFKQHDLLNINSSLKFELYLYRHLSPHHKQPIIISHVQL